MIRSRLPPMLDGPHDQPSGDQPGAFGTPDGEPPGDGLPGDVTPSRAPPPGGDQGEFSQRVSLFNTYALHARGVLESVQNGTFSIDEQAAAIDLVRDSLHEAWGALESTAVPRQYVQDVAKLRLHWRSLQANPVFADPAAERDANAERIGLNQAIGSCDAITREAMYVIALDRLREWVLAQEPEYVVDLHRVLRDEIPNQAHREEVIEWLSSAPRVLAGVGAIIEPETGLIYRTYDRWPGRVGREAFVVLLILGTVAATILLAPFVSGDAAGTAADAAAVNAQAAGGDAQVPGAPRTQLMVIWIACLFGLLAHSVLTTYRSLRAGRLNGAFPLRRATTLLSARSGVITLRVLSTWVAFMALMVLVGHDAVVAEVVLMAKRLLASGPAAPDRVGVACAGVVVEGRVRAMSPELLPGWHDYPLVERLEADLGLPVAALNDAQAAALGEARHGAGRGYDSLLFVTVSTGVGGGLVLGGRLWQGATGLAGHVGHMAGGELERVASGTALARLAAEAGHAGLGAREVIEEAEAGAEWALRLVVGAADALAQALADVKVLVDPEIVVLGGGVGLNPAFRQAVVSALARSDARMRSPVVPAALGTAAGLVGAGCWSVTEADHARWS